jgi:anti-sigma factor RsiW
VSCHRARELIDPFIDGELDRRQTGAFRRHLDQCEACKLAYNNQLTLRSGLKGTSLYYRPTNALRGRIRESLRHSLKHTLDSVVGTLL